MSNPLDPVGELMALADKYAEARAGGPGTACRARLETSLREALSEQWHPIEANVDTLMRLHDEANSLMGDYVAERDPAKAGATFDEMMAKSAALRAALVAEARDAALYRYWQPWLERRLGSLVPYEAAAPLPPTGERRQHASD